MNSAEWRDLSPIRLFRDSLTRKSTLLRNPRCIDYCAKHKQLVHRERSRPAKSRRPNEQEATGPHQLWSWDITYLRGSGSRQFLLPVYDRGRLESKDRRMADSRKGIAGAGRLSVQETCAYLKLDPDGLVLHSDNGGPMKGSTMLATLQKLGVVCFIQQTPRQRRQSLLRGSVPNSQVPAGIHFGGFLLGRACSRLDQDFRHLVQHRASAQCHTLRHSRRAA